MDACVNGREGGFLDHSNERDLHRDTTPLHWQMPKISTSIPMVAAPLGHAPSRDKPALLLPILAFLSKNRQ